MNKVKKPVYGATGLHLLSGIALSCLPASILFSAAVTPADAPPPPGPEPVRIEKLPLPPTAPKDTPGSCTKQVNPRQTGCMSALFDGIIEGPAFLGDGKHILLSVYLTGAPAAPDPSSIYNGPQVLAIKTDGRTFANGDAWKCITCGIPHSNLAGANLQHREPNGPPRGIPNVTGLFLDHPQPFPGDRKMIAGTNVVDCGPYKLIDDRCTADRLHVYPIRWNTTPDGSGSGGSMRELRLNPDGEHLMWSHMNRTGMDIDQHGLVGKLVFRPSPTGGVPRTARYELENIFVLTNSNNPDFAAFRDDPKRPGHLIRNVVMGAIGEARGWTRDGQNAVGMGMPDSGSVDMYITELKSGVSHRLTSAPGYADPILMSPDDKWFVVFDNRLTDRHMYYGGIAGIPPLTDQLTRMIMLSADYGYRNGMRRFFQPFLIDRWGDRGTYQGQQLNAGSGAPGSPSDPNWNARADPAWSPDGTSIVYWQAMVTAPDCGGANPLPCPRSTEAGGRASRLMIARLTSRKPVAPRKIVSRTINVPWGTAYRAGDAMPKRYPYAPAGKFVLDGRKSGSAQVEIRKPDGEHVTYVSAKYSHYSDDGITVIDGSESSELTGQGQKVRVIWHSDLKLTGQQTGTKKTSEPGGFVMSLWGQPLGGELVTTLGDKVYKPPLPGS